MGKKAEFRFYVRAADGRISTTWSIVASRSDVYVTPLLMKESSKVSLHQSGDCNWSLRSEYLQAGGPSVNGARHIAQWKHIDASKPALRILIPESELRSDNRTTQKKVSILDLKPGVDAICINCFVIGGDASAAAPIGQSTKIFEHALENGATFSCLLSYRQINSDEREGLIRVKDWAARQTEKNVYGVARIHFPGRVSGLLEYRPLHAPYVLSDPLARTTWRRDATDVAAHIEPSNTERSK
ncbi:hypothetical protein [Burkholderia sp. Bp9031]|uniref:hypothetical protein n=1 Tax=Burkholderia sp. Bp9031 TaxID=2184566 RepID=UPI000F5D83FF|nr:hypothetical protein [Burkholderia sp. Bp9031]